MRAVVVGAGLAGLAAADELVRSGSEVVVLEARDRVGGRVWSRTLPNGAVVEMGAEYILPGNTEVLGLAERFGLGLWDKGMRYGRRDPRGGIGTSHAELADAVAHVERALPSAPPGTTAGAFLEALDIPAGAREAIVARVEISSGETADRVAAAALVGIAHIDDEPAPSIAGGNQRLAAALAGELEPSVYLGHTARRVEWSDDGVCVRTDGGDVDGEGCVIAVPASVLDRIEFDPALPGWLESALEAVRYGHAAKLFVPLAEPAPPSAVMSVPERYWSWTATGAGDRPQAVVSAFAGSRPALDALGTRDGPDRWLASLTRLRGDLRLDLGGALLSTWDDDPWVRAAYSTTPPPELAEAVERPAGPLAFAGEHTAGEYHGLMEGAIRSGRRAARSLALRA